MSNEQGLFKKRLDLPPWQLVGSSMGIIEKEKIVIWIDEAKKEFPLCIVAERKGKMWLGLKPELVVQSAETTLSNTIDAFSEWYRKWFGQPSV